MSVQTGQLVHVTLAGDGELLDFVGAAGGGGGVDCDLEKLSAGVQHTNEILFVGFRGLMGNLEGTRGVG